MMEVVVESPETGGRVTGIVMDFPVTDDGAVLCSPPMIPPRLRRRLSGAKANSPSSVEEIEAKLRDADLRRQKFYENLSSKARPKPRSPSQSSSHDEDLGQRLEAKLQAAEQKRQSILEKAKMRLAKLDELRQAAKIGVEMRYKKERAELGTKVESRVQKAEANRMLILKSYCQRRATLKERTSQSILRRIARESKYKQRVHAAICQKRAAAERKRLVLLEADKKRAHARVLQVRKVAKSVSQQREIERRTLRDKLEDRLQRAKRHRADYLMQRARQQNSIPASWTKRQKQADHLSRKLARCWKKFLKMRRTTLDLTKAYDALNINESSIKMMPFEQLALLIESASTLQTAKAVLDRLESRFKVSRAVNSTSLDDLNHLLKRVASPNRRPTPRKSGWSKDAKKQGSVREAAKSTVELSRYQVRVVLCAYMILGHPDAVFSGRGEREYALTRSAEKFVEEFELLIRIILDGPVHSSDEESDPALTRRWTFRSQLAAFDAAWSSYLNSFVVWKVKDAESLEEDLVRAACQLELSMIQKCKLTPEGDSGALTHDLKAIQRQVADDQKLLREKVLHLSGGAGIQRMENALSDTRMKYFEARENENTVGLPPITHILSSSMPSPSSSACSSSVGSVGKDFVMESERPNRVVRSLFKDNDPLSCKEDASSASSEKLDVENELIVNEIVHEQRLIYADSSNPTDEGQNGIKTKLRVAMEKAFWDGITESMKQDEPNYERVVELMRQVRDELCDMAPQSWKQKISEAIDIEILSQVLNSGMPDMDYLGKILESALVTLQKLSAAAHEDELKEAHQNLLKELAELCHAGYGSNYSRDIALVKGLRFVLEQIQALKQEISKARIGIMEPLLKGPAGLDYLGNAFAKRYGPPSDALIALPLTTRWISSVWANRDQEWGDHTNALSEVRSRHDGLPHTLIPSTTLRTGGSFSARTTESQVTSFPLNATQNVPDGRHPGCKGEKVDLLVRLALLKLVSEVSGLTEEALPETLKLNLSRLRAVQAQLQKIVVTATSVLILRQTLLSEQIIGNAEDMDNMVSRCGNEVSVLVDTVEDVGVEEIIEILSKLVEERVNSNDAAKIQSRKSVMARMLTKSLQAGDAVFVRVSHAVYLATRGVVLGGAEKHGRLLTEISLRQIGAAVLTDWVVEAAKVLVVAATVSGSVHGPWYTQIVENM